jgi:hypothetical protein
MGAKVHIFRNPLTSNENIKKNQIFLKNGEKHFFSQFYKKNSIFAA